MERRKDSKGRVLKDGESFRKSDGLYMYRWTSKDSKRHTVYSPTLEGLREKEETIKHDLRDGVKTGESNITVNDMYEMWKNDKVGLKGTTRSNYIYMYEHFLKDNFGCIKLQSVKRSDVRRLYNSLIDTKRMSVSTLESIHTVLHQVFKLAVEDNYIRTNPSDEMFGECKKAHNFETPKRHALTIPQQKAFMNYLKNTPQYRHWLPIFTFFLGTGCRVSEVVGIRWGDINFKYGVIDINHNLVYYKKEQGGCEFSISTPKTKAGTRMIPLLPEVREALEEEKAFQKECGVTCQSSIDGYTNFVFLNRFGKVHNQQTLNRTIRRIILNYNEQEMEKADKQHREPLLLPPFSCHNLRHTFATRYCENETNLKVIQEILGHKDIATTMEVYAEATQEAKVKSFTNMDGKILVS